MSGIYADPNTKYVGIGTTAPLQKLHLVGDALVSGHVLPGACNVYNLGSADSRWKDLYLSGNTIDLGGTFLKRDEESGGIKIQSESGLAVDTNVRNLNASGYVDINGTRLARHVTGPLMVQTATGEMESGMFKHVYVDGTVRASNLEILGDFVKMNTVTSNTEQMVIENAGTGPALKVTQTGVNSIAEFYDDGGVLALKIADGGNVGIGISNPFSKLHLEGNMQATELVIAGTQFVGPTYLGATKPTYSFAGDTNTGIFGPDFDNVGISCGGVERMRVLSNGNVGIGTTIPLAKLHVFGSVQANSFTGPLSSTLTRGAYLIGNNFNGSASTTWDVDATSANTASKIVARDASGNFNANVVSSTRCDVNTVQALYMRSVNTSEPLGCYSVISGTSWPTATLQLRELNLEGAGSGTVASAPSIAFHWSGRVASQIRIEPNGRIAIVNNPGTDYEAFVCSALSKSSGTFDIQHPTQPNKRLLHSFVEGPRCDLIYRGSKSLIDGVTKVDLDVECTHTKESSMTQGTFVALCTNPIVFLQNNGSFDRVKGTISEAILTITCENAISCDVIDWLVIAERKDEFIKSWNKTTSEGFLITEHDGSL